MDKICNVEVSILVYAMRYAMGRQTFSPSIAIDNIKHNVSSIDTRQIGCMIRDIEEYKEQFSFGMDCDEDLWLGFRDYLEGVLVDRGGL